LAGFGAETQTCPVNKRFVCMGVTRQMAPLLLGFLPAASIGIVPTA
jgi:hypothetical protein